MTEIQEWNASKQHWLPNFIAYQNHRDDLVKTQISAIFPSDILSPRCTPSSGLPSVSHSRVWKEAWKFAFLTSVRMMLILLTGDTTLRTICAVVNLNWLNVAFILKGPLHFQKYLFLDKRVFGSLSTKHTI